MFDPKKILVLSPHTDDGELGCGGTIARLVHEKKEVHYVAFSSCSKSLPHNSPPDTLVKECKAAMKQLGVNEGKVMIYDFEVREFKDKRQEILDEMISLDKYIHPDLILIPSATDKHQDHQVIHQEAMRAFKNSSVMGYEEPWNQSRFDSTFYMKISDNHLFSKIKALEQYESQKHRAYIQEDFIRSLARVRGVQADSHFAEAFEVYRILA